MRKHSIIWTVLLLMSHHVMAFNATEMMTLNHHLGSQVANFASIEHRYLGDSLKIVIDNKPSRASLKPLTLPNGLRLTYGEIVMLSNDFIGNYNYPIATCPLSEKSACFEKQFHQLAYVNKSEKIQCSSLSEQVERFNKFSHQIQLELNEARKQGISDWNFYQEKAGVINKKLNTISCGGSFVSDYLPFGNYLKLAQVNFDHFAPSAPQAYVVGHKQALKQALLAYHAWHDENDNDKANRLLHLAYAKNAYASHYLTDSMSSGHMRTPRLELDKQVHLPRIFIILIANLMHDEDNEYGIHVVNHLGTHWTSYGDGNLFTKEATKQRLVLLNTMQLSLEEVYRVYKTGVLPNTYQEMKLLPDYEKIEQLNETAPLFKVIDGTVAKRKSIHNRYRHEYTKLWSGLATLLEFKVSKS